MGSPYLKMRLYSLFPCSHLSPTEDEEGLKGSKIRRKGQHKIIPYHPLLNVLILEHVLNFFTPGDLLDFRLVCKLWNDEIVTRLQNTTRGNYLLRCKEIGSDKDAQKFTKIVKGSERFPANKFMIKIPKMSPTFSTLFESLNFQQSVVTLQVTVSSSDFAKLLETLCYLMNLTDLRINRVPEESVQNLFTTRDGYSPSCRLRVAHKLEKLRTISFRNSYPRKRFLCSYTQFIVDFLKRCDNLEFLEFSHWSSSLTNIFREVPLGQLRHLNVKGKTLGHIDVSLLMSKNLRYLKSIQVIVDSHVSEELLQAFLQSCSTSLRSYTVIRP